MPVNVQELALQETRSLCLRLLPTAFSEVLIFPSWPIPATRVMPLKMRL